MCKMGVGIQLKIVGGKYLKAILCAKKITLNKAGQKGGDDGLGHRLGQLRDLWVQYSWNLLWASYLRTNGSACTLICFS